MATFTQASARTAIEVAEASEIARMARRDDPNVLAREDMQRLLGDSALVLDGLRARPHYFDGRFLTGADLTCDQDYIRQRQADLARAGGTGVVTGLHVSLGSDPAGQTLVIQAGHGITPSGDVVMIARQRSVVALDLPSIERLDATLGLRRDPRVPLGRRTGLFLLALRPVEFTANPIAAYPTSIAGRREIEDGDVIEATAITLIPWSDTGGAATLDEARRAVARTIFLGHASGLPQNALPLAMIAMERGAIRWIDRALVRRETGADTPLQVSLGARPRALAEAFVVQHRQHLRDVLASRADGGLGASFAAAQYFAALPAAGQLPASTILVDNLGFRQLWFPPAVDVEVSFVPDDEIAALVEDSLALPPIDLLGEPEDLDATAVVVLAPVTRSRLQRLQASLSKISRPALADPAQGYRRAPADMLAAMLARRVKLVDFGRRDLAAVDTSAAADAETAAWQAAWAEAVNAIPVREGSEPLLWYVRRRAVADRSRIQGVAVAIGGDDERLAGALETRIGELGLEARFDRVIAASTPFAVARLTGFLASPRIAGSDMFLAAAVNDLEDAIPAPGSRLDALISASAVPELTRSSATTESSRPGTVPARDLGAASGLRAARATATDAAATVLAGAGDLVARTPNFARRGVARLSTSRATLATALRADPKPAKLSEADVADIASDYADARLGDGIERIAARLEAPINREQQLWLGETGLALELDEAGRHIGATDFAEFVGGVGRAIARKDTAELARLVGAG